MKFMGQAPESRDGEPGTGDRKWQCALMEYEDVSRRFMAIIPALLLFPDPRPLMQLPVAHLADAVCVRGDLRVVVISTTRVAVVAQPPEQGEDFLAGLRIQRAGGFVGEQDRRMS